MTPSATTTSRTFSDEQLAELLDLIKESDSVELKLTVPEFHQRTTVVALGMDPLDAQIRQVFFFDTRVNWPHHIFVDASFKVVGAN